MVASFGVGAVLGAAAVVALVVYVGKKYHSAKAALAAVKAELKQAELSASTEVRSLVSRLKTLL